MSFMVTSAHASLYGSRLIRLLRGLTDESPDPALNNFALHFGKLADLSGSMSLLNAHESIDHVTTDDSACDLAAAREDFMKVRTALIRAVVMSFVPPRGLTPVRMVKLPTAEKLHSHYQATGVYGAPRPWLPKVYAAAFDPYAAFYVARQRDLAMKVRRLREHQRKLVRQASDEHAQLAALDEALDDALNTRTQELFSVIPKLLARRFGKLAFAETDALPKRSTARDLEPWLEPDGWITRFCGDMRELLLAELEIRLRPVIGLMESLPGGDSEGQASIDGKELLRD